MAGRNLHKHSKDPWSKTLRRLVDQVSGKEMVGFSSARIESRHGPYGEDRFWGADSNLGREFKRPRNQSAKSPEEGEGGRISHQKKNKNTRWKGKIFEGKKQKRKGNEARGETGEE